MLLKFCFHVKHYPGVREVAAHTRRFNSAYRITQSIETRALLSENSLPLLTLLTTTTLSKASNVRITYPGAFVQPLVQWKGKKNITYSECVFVALGTQHANAYTTYCHLKSVRLYIIFSHYLIEGTIFGWEKILKWNVCWSSCKVPFLINRF